MMADRHALAWIGVFDGEPDPEFIWQDEATARRWINTRPGVELAPLYLSPSLTDAERTAMELFASTGWTGLRWSEVERHAATLRGLLERIVRY